MSSLPGFFIAGERAMMRHGPCVGAVLKNRDTTLTFVPNGAWSPSDNLPRGRRWYGPSELIAALDRELRRDEEKRR